MKPQIVLQVAQLRGALQVVEQTLKVQLNFCAQLECQREHFQTQIDELQGGEQ